MKSFFKYQQVSVILILVLFFTTFLSFRLFAQGDLLLYPKRIVFEDVNKKRVQQINLTNVGTDSAFYNVYFIQYRMGEMGNFERITEPEPGQLFASPYIRIFPRSVVLAPKESQSVRLQLSRVNELQDGEYRSHIYFRSTKTVQPLGSDDTGVSDDKSITVKLVPAFGISIPCIIKKGEDNSSASISDLQLELNENGAYFLKMAINRKGNMSTYGDIIVNYVNDKNEKTEVAKVRGVAVYHPSSIRRSRLKLNDVKGINFNSGKFEVKYIYNEKGEDVVMAESEMTLN